MCMLLRIALSVCCHRHTTIRVVSKCFSVSFVVFDTGWVFLRMIPERAKAVGVGVCGCTEKIRRGVL